MAKIPAKKTYQPAARPAKVSGDFQLKMPLLWLAAAVALLYFPTLKLGFTELDDKIFIVEQAAYNHDIGHLATSFHRGVFSDSTDVYYRPLLLNSFIINAQMSGTEIRGFHLFNLVMHLGAVLVLFVLLSRLLSGARLEVLPAFLLTLFFAVHPVLAQAVAWVPGRNDSMLGLATFGFLIWAIDFSDSGRPARFLLQFLALLAAFFTKETAVFAAPVGFVVLVVLLGKNWREPRQLALFGSWALAFAIWFAVRSSATLKNEQLAFGEVLAGLPARLPVLLTYFGKTILPVNLSVFPIQKDTAIWPGLVAVGLLAAGLFFGKKVVGGDPNNGTGKVVGEDANNGGSAGKFNWKWWLGGAAIFLLFLAPALLVNPKLNDQDFEHRLYLPMLGVLVLLSQTVVFQSFMGKRKLLWAGVAVCAGLAVVNFLHQKKFSDPRTFWTQAKHDSPHSAYATMMLAARMDEVDLPRAKQLIREAYALNPETKYIGYYMGKMLLDEDSTAAAEAQFRREIERSNYFECHFHLAQILFQKQDFAGAIEHLEAYLKVKQDDGPANNNLLLLYRQTGQSEQEKLQVAQMRSLGLKVPAGF